MRKRTFGFGSAERASSQPETQSTTSRGRCLVNGRTEAASEVKKFIGQQEGTGNGERPEAAAAGDSEFALEREGGNPYSGQFHVGTKKEHLEIKTSLAEHAIKGGRSRFPIAIYALPYATSRHPA